MKPKNMIVSTEMFTNSFYYPAPGFDIQPLKRFTHLCDNFLYANLFINKEDVLKWYTRELNSGDFEILETTTYDDFREEDFFELDNNYRQHLANWPRLYMQKNELSDYLQTFEPAHQLPQFLIHFRVKRKSLDKVINLYYFTGEGIASYIVLSKNGEYAPRVLGTIQTGMMERPTGIMNNFYSNENNARPLLWLRGFEPDGYFYGFGGNDNDALENLGVFSMKVIDFSSWRCGRYNDYGDTRRYVKAFITETQNLNIHNLSNNYSSENHTYRIERINPDNEAYTNNFVVCGAHHLNQLMQINNQINGVAWENLLDYNTNCASMQIERLQNYLEANNITENLLIFPHCTEDEGKLYHESILTIKNRTETVLSSPYDFFDLFVTE
jgi:hypothetical protein